MILAGFQPEFAYAYYDEDVPIAPSLITIKTTGYKPKDPSDRSREGEEMFKDLNCTACHSIHNVGGDIGPILDGIGAHRNEDYMYALLANTENEKTKFALLTDQYVRSPYHPRVREATAKLLVDFLVTLPEPPGGFVVTPHATRRAAKTPESNSSFKPSPLSQESEEGKVIYDSLGCVACHSINKVGGWLGPQLDGIGGRHDRAYILQYITKAGVVARQSLNEEVVPPDMPSFNLSQRQLEKISDYLLSLPNDK